MVSVVSYGVSLVDYAEHVIEVDVATTVVLGIAVASSFGVPHMSYEI